MFYSALVMHSVHDSVRTRMYTNSQLRDNVARWLQPKTVRIQAVTVSNHDGLILPDSEAIYRMNANRELCYADNTPPSPDLACLTSRPRAMRWSSLGRSRYVLARNSVLHAALLSGMLVRSFDVRRCTNRDWLLGGCCGCVWAAMP